MGCTPARNQVGLRGGLSAPQSRVRSGTPSRRPGTRTPPRSCCDPYRGEGGRHRHVVMVRIAQGLVISKASTHPAGSSTASSVTGSTRTTSAAGSAARGGSPNRIVAVAAPRRTMTFNARVGASTRHPGAHSPGNAIVCSGATTWRTTPAAASGRPWAAPGPNGSSGQFDRDRTDRHEQSVESVDHREGRRRRFVGDAHPPQIGLGDHLRGALTVAPAHRHPVVASGATRRRPSEYGPSFTVPPVTSHAITCPVLYIQPGGAARARGASGTRVGPYERLGVWSGVTWTPGHTPPTAERRWPSRQLTIMSSCAQYARVLVILASSSNVMTSMGSMT